METATATRQGLNHDEIAAKAYQIWKSSGRLPGSELKNWLQAEMELASAKAANREQSPEPTQKPASFSSSRSSPGKSQSAQASAQPRRARHN